MRRYLVRVLLWGLLGFTHLHGKHSGAPRGKGAFSENVGSPSSQDDAWTSLLRMSPQMLEARKPKTWAQANPTLNYTSDFLARFKEHTTRFHRLRAALPNPAERKCNFLDVGGRNGESIFLAGKCRYWIVDIGRQTSKRDRVLGCDIENLESCHGGAESLPKFDIVHSQNTFEHLREPWQAMRTIGALTNPGAMLLLIAPFSWRYHAVQWSTPQLERQYHGSYGDYLRYTHSEFEYLSSKYANFSVVESGYDDSVRRIRQQGHLGSASDGVKFDAHGGWLEAIHCYYIGKKR